MSVAHSTRHKHKASAWRKLCNETKYENPLSSFLLHSPSCAVSKVTRLLFPTKMIPKSTTAVTHSPSEFMLSHKNITCNYSIFTPRAHVYELCAGQDEYEES